MAIWFLKNIYYFNYVFVVSVHLSSSAHRGQRYQTLQQELQKAMMCWELNSGPLEEVDILLTAKPFLKSGYMFLPPIFLLCRVHLKLPLLRQSH